MINIDLENETLKKDLKEWKWTRRTEGWGKSFELERLFMNLNAISWNWAGKPKTTSSMSCQIDEDKQYVCLKDTGWLFLLLFRKQCIYTGKAAILKTGWYEFNMNGKPLSYEDWKVNNKNALSCYLYMYIQSI